MKITKILSKTKILILAITLSLSSFVFLSFEKDNDFELAKNLDIYYTLFRELDLYYVDEIDVGKLVKSSIDNMLQDLDPYTNYIPESQIEDYRFMTTGQYGGIGVLVHEDEGKFIVGEVYEGAAADKAGIKIGDEIISISNNQLKGRSFEEISKLLRGQQNTQIKIELKRPNIAEILQKNVTYEVIKIGNVPYYGFVNNDFGYIVLSGFTDDAALEIRNAFLKLKQEKNMKGLILDLRGNPGGLLIEAVNIVNLFVPKGKEVVNMKGKVKQWNRVFKAESPSLDEEIPIVVLVNSGSASASEIVSGALQDLDRAVVLGQRTFGKGLVQTTRKLSYNAQMKVTTAKYYIPSGRCIQALDYSHRNIDGSVGKVPDSLITKFETANGRPVFDGGGIMPDFETSTKNMSNITISLLSKNLIFKYATQYTLKNKEIALAKDFKFSDNDYEGFKNFLKDKNFDYKTESEEILNQLLKTAKKEKYLEQTKKEFEVLKKKLAHDKNKDLNIFKDEIKGFLSKEIVTRYYYQKGRYENSLHNDIDVKEAVKLLNSPKEYKKLLTPQ